MEIDLCWKTTCKAAPIASYILMPPAINRLILLLCFFGVAGFAPPGASQSVCVSLVSDNNDVIKKIIGFFEEQGFIVNTDELITRQNSTFRGIAFSRAREDFTLDCGSILKSGCIYGSVIQGTHSRKIKVSISEDYRSDNSFEVISVIQTAIQKIKDFENIERVSRIYTGAELVKIRGWCS